MPHIGLPQETEAPEPVSPLADGPDQPLLDHLVRRSLSFALHLLVEGHVLVAEPGFPVFGLLVLDVQAEAPRLLPGLHPLLVVPFLLRVLRSEDEAVGSVAKEVCFEPLHLDIEAATNAAEAITPPMGGEERMYEGLDVRVNELHSDSCGGTLGPKVRGGASDHPTTELHARKMQRHRHRLPWRLRHATVGRLFREGQELQLAPVGAPESLLIHSSCQGPGGRCGQGIGLADAAAAAPAAADFGDESRTAGHLFRHRHPRQGRFVVEHRAPHKGQLRTNPFLPPRACGPDAHSSAIP
mmetsp:Transcript_33812/g.71840  ORF Transcript_33812/g.71840 Transcript_33812/m.71840 type:complete len:297 (-) Transcript_33812:100-990(-)